MDQLKELNRQLRWRMITTIGNVSLDVEDNRGPHDWPTLGDLSPYCMKYSMHFPLEPTVTIWPSLEWWSDRSLYRIGEIMHARLCWNWKLNKASWEYYIYMSVPCWSIGNCTQLHCKSTTGFFSTVVYWYNGTCTPIVQNRLILWKPFWSIGNWQVRTSTTGGDTTNNQHHPSIFHPLISSFPLHCSLSRET
jgi:hypothetical protein